VPKELYSRYYGSTGFNIEAEMKIMVCVRRRGYEKAGGHLREKSMFEDEPQKRMPK
jgi:hypothetical protein